MRVPGVLAYIQARCMLALLIGLCMLYRTLCIRYGQFYRSISSGSAKSGREWTENDLKAYDIRV